MAADFDIPPLYDPLINGNKLSDVWKRYESNFYNTIIEYLTQFGIFMPRVTTAQRNSIITPINGQMIYNTTIDAPQIYQAGAWKTFTTS